MSKEAAQKVGELTEKWYDVYMSDRIATSWIKHTGNLGAVCSELEIGRTTLWRWLEKDCVQKVMAEKIHQASQNTGATVEWILAQLKDIAERCMQTREAVDKKGKPMGVFLFDSKGATRALELLGKYHKMFVDRNVVENPDGSPLKLKEISDEQLDARLSVLLGKAGINPVIGRATETEEETQD